MIYLNEPVKGGETAFINAKTPSGDPLSISPVKGKAILWNNLWSKRKEEVRPDQAALAESHGPRFLDLNPHAEHEGVAVEEGEKLIITTWFRES